MSHLVRNLENWFSRVVDHMKIDTMEFNDWIGSNLQQDNEQCKLLPNQSGFQSTHFVCHLLCDVASFFGVRLMGTVKDQKYFHNVGNSMCIFIFTRKIILHLLANIFA